MPAGLRLLLASATLATFWLALFVMPVPPAPDAAGAAGALDSLQAASRDAFDEGRWQDALGPTQMLVKRFPRQHLFWERLAHIHQKLDQPDEEAAAWEAFMERSPLPAEACPQIGQAYRRLNQLERALAALERCLAADPNDPELAFFAGLGNEWLARFEPAREHYEKAIALAPIHNDSAVGLARLRLHRNQYREALALVSGVLARAPSHVDALVVAGLAEQRAGHRQEARVHLEKAASLSAGYFDVHLALGILEFGEARLAAARRHFEKAQKLDAGRMEELQPWLRRTAAVRNAS